MMDYKKLKVAIPILTLAFISFWSADGNLGATSENINSRYLLSASTSLLSILSGIGIIGFVLFFSLPKTTQDHSEIVGAWRRLGAFYIDFIIILIALSPILAFPMILAEYYHTGIFEWSFQRQSSRGSDFIIMLPMILIMFGALFCYFYIFPYKNRQTIGQYLLNYKIVDSSNEFDSPDFSARVFYAAIGMCSWPFALYFASKDPDKDFWWDNKSNTRAVRVQNSKL